MNQQDLSKLGKKDLILLLMNLTSENDTLKSKIMELQTQADSKEIKINHCGSMAEAAMVLNDIFAKADESAQQYLTNVKALEDEQKKLKLEAETSLLFTQQKCYELEENTKQRCASIEEQTAVKCEQMVKAAKEEADNYQKNVMERINQLKEEYEKAFSIFKNL